MGFFSKVWKSVKNIGRGISKTLKRAAKSTTKALKKAWKSPIVRGVIIAAAMYFSAGTLAPALAGATGLSATAAGAITGAATMSVVNGVGAGVSGESVGKGMATGAVQGAVAGAAAGYFSGASGAADAAGSTAGSTVGSTAGQTVTNTAVNQSGSGLVDMPWVSPGLNSAGQNVGTQLANTATTAATNTGTQFFTGDSLLSKAGNGIVNYVSSNPLEVTKMVMGGINSANTPDAIDILNKRAEQERQTMAYKQSLNGVPTDNGQVTMGGLPSQSGLLNITPSERLQLQSTPSLLANPAATYNARAYT